MAALITTRTFKFLRELAAHNNRQWFTVNKQRYVDEVRDPLLILIAQLGSPLAKISRHIVADPRPVGGSLFRIYRDTRFSKDKSPYKTHAGLHFGARGKGMLGAGYYLHLEPRNVFMAAGVWHPEAATLKKLRDAIVAKPKQWQRVVRAVELDEGHDGRLTRPPQGYDAAHPFVEDLKRRSFTASTSFTETQACAPDFPKRFIKACEHMAPLMEFLTTAVGLRW